MPRARKVAASGTPTQRLRTLQKQYDELCLAIEELVAENKEELCEQGLLAAKDRLEPYGVKIDVHPKVTIKLNLTVDISDCEPHLRQSGYGTVWAFDNTSETEFLDMLEASLERQMFNGMEITEVDKENSSIEYVDRL